MIKLIDHGVYYSGGSLTDIAPDAKPASQARQGTIAAGILAAHNTSDSKSDLKIKFDALASHDITYVGILLTARSGGLDRIPVPYVLTNCHNSLCAVGGTINEDDHMFGLSAAKRHGAIYVPAHQAVIHSFMREMMSGCGKMILGSDSHTRYGALGTLAVGEGGPELVKQLLSKTYDIKSPDVIAVHLTGAPRPGVGPQDVALSIIKAVFASGFVKNKILEFIGDGISSLPIEYRNGIDVMTTETTCLSSVWVTDDATKEYFVKHGRPEEYKKLSPAEGAYYEGAVMVDLSEIEPMIALPFHPSNAFTVRELNENAEDILRETEIAGEKKLSLAPGSLRLTDKIDRVSGRVRVNQGVIAGCAGGTYDNICAAADVLRGKSIGADEFALSIYPASQPMFVRMTETGIAADLMKTGATLRSAFCGPCFGAGDVPANGGLSIRHSTRNFPNREGSKPNEGQAASVALMDARSIAATAASGGLLTGADELDIAYSTPDYKFDKSIYEKRCWFGYGKADPEAELKFGPNIIDWPEMKRLPEHMLMNVASLIDDDVTTTDELIPSGETSSYRSNPYRLSRFALSRRDSGYVGRTDVIRAAAGMDENSPLNAYTKVSEAETEAAKADIESVYSAYKELCGIDISDTAGIGTIVCSLRPGDGSAREQAASCQRVLGTTANLCREYATKRYRSNLINWGMLPLMNDDITIGKSKGKSGKEIKLGDYILLPGVRSALISGAEELSGYIWHKESGELSRHTFKLGSITDEERKIILAGNLAKYCGEDLA